MPLCTARPIIVASRTVCRFGGHYTRRFHMRKATTAVWCDNRIHQQLIFAHSRTPKYMVFVVGCATYYCVCTSTRCQRNPLRSAVTEFSFWDRLQRQCTSKHGTEREKYCCAIDYETIKTAKAFFAGTGVKIDTQTSANQNKTHHEQRHNASNEPDRHCQPNKRRANETRSKQLDASAPTCAHTAARIHTK